MSDMEMETWDTEISAKSPPLRENIVALGRYKDLILLFVKRSFVTQYKQTILGPLWVFIRPLITTLIFTAVFGNLAGLPTDRVPPFLFYMCGNIAWMYFQNCLTETSTVFLTNYHILGKVYFPRLALPISTVISHLVTMAVQFLFFMVLYGVFIFMGAGVRPTLFLLMIPLFVLQMAFLGLGLGVIVSSVTIRYRDLAFLVSFGAQLWMYATPVAYASSIIPEKWLWLYMLNPMAPVIEGVRHAFFGSGIFLWWGYGVGWVVTLAICVIGVAVFNRVENTFMDVI